MFEKQPLPVDRVMLDQDRVDDVGAVVTVARLEEELGEDELRRRGDADGRP
jgi:hypothetical protein